MANWAKLQEDTIGKQVVKRAHHGIHFDNGDGQVLAHFSGASCHYLDGGIYKPIDTKLLLTPDGFYGCPHSPVRVHRDGHVKVDGTNYAQYTELPSAQTGLVDGDKIVRPFSFGEQRLWVTEDGFRSEIQLNRIPTLTEARKLIASESGTLSKEYLKSLTTAEDANGDVHTYSTLTAFRTWLASAAFPVVIDPDFLAGTADHVVYSWSTSSYATANSTSAAEGNTAFLSCGQTNVDAFLCARIFLLFDTSSIGAGSTVTQVNLKLTVIDDFSSTDFTPIIKTFNWNGLTREQKFDGILTADSDDSDFGSTGTGSWANNTLKTSGNLSTAWVNKTGTTFYGIVSDRDIAAIQPSNPEIVNFGSASYSVETRRAYLSVTYTEAASGSLLRVNMNAQMQNLSGNMRG